MFPRLGRVHLCAFSDEALYGEVAQKAAFFQSPDFYGVDLSALHAPANAGYFGQVGRRRRVACAACRWLLYACVAEARRGEAGGGDALLRLPRRALAPPPALAPRHLAP